MTTASSTRAPLTAQQIHEGVTASVAAAPVFGVVRTDSRDQALRQARAFRDAGIVLVEITFTVPGALEVVEALLEEREGSGPPWVGMGTVTTPERARQALAVGAEFVITPNVNAAVAEIARGSDVFLVLGALTPSEIAAAAELEPDLVKTYPLPPVGGPGYLATVRLPLPDVPILASGGFGPEEIPDYRRVGAVAFGLGAQLFGPDAESSRRRIQEALEAARS
ncbi:MAG: bifunctional 4-hydroxy-2-oxoglutarate aldolase/2-dehydro-3-deoxy-phosphogluconate aldolase [Thermoanaerobaculia bacterium]